MSYWLGYVACKLVPEMTCYVTGWDTKPFSLALLHSIKCIVYSLLIEGMLLDLYNIGFNSDALHCDGRTENICKLLLF